MSVEISVHSPTDYVKKNFKNFLPDWVSPPVSVVIVLQHSHLPLINQGIDVEKEKDFLRDKFICFGRALSLVLNEEGFVTDAIDPRSGYALLSKQGSSSHDDCQVIHQLLKIPIIKKDRCKALDHPSWGTAVYPGILISSASTEKVQPLIENIALNQGWKI